MLQKSLKWMLLTLLLAGLLIGGIVWIVSAVSAPAIAAATPAPTPAAPSAIPAAAPPPSPSPTASPAPPETPEPETDWLAAYMDTMTIEQKLGQLVMFGGSGTNRPDSDFASILQDYPVGNIVLYGSNIAKNDDDGGFLRAQRLLSAIAETSACDLPSLVSIDVEGGDVVRFRWDTWPLSARKLGSRNDPDEAYQQFLSIGRKLLETGINMNLAPVLDVSDDPMRTFLTTRIISSDEEIVSSIGVAIIEGLHDAGCLATAKHFPGHGGTTADSHATTPVIRRSAESLAAYDLVPFTAAIDAGVDVVLVAHILYPSLDEERIATLSPAIITGLLREQLGFDGIVLSDDFRMGGLTGQCGAGEAAVRFLLAGGDLILCGPQHEAQREIMEALLSAASDGTLTEERIDESVARILQKKMLVTGWSPVPGSAG